MNISLDDTFQLHINQNKQLLTLLFLTFIFVFSGCSGSTSSDTDDTDQPQDPEEVTVTEEEAVDALITVMKDSGMTFPSRDESSKNKAADTDLFAMDYIELDTSPNGLIQLKMWIGAEGNIIPKPSWQSANQNVCSNQGRYMKGAVKQLEFTILATSQEVQLNYTDLETGKIEESVIGVQNESNDDADGSNWLTEAMEDAWSDMQDKVTIGGAVGPCGDEMGLQMKFSSEITTDLTTDEEEPVVYFEHVEASFPLTFDEDKRAFTGQGNLKWTSWQFNGREGDNPPSGNLEIIQLVTPKIDNPEYEEPALELELPGFEDGTPLTNLSWPLLHSYEQNEEGDNYTYIITDWEVNTSDDSVVMTKKIDRTESYTVDGNPVEITELTTIEIRRE